MIRRECTAEVEREIGRAQAVLVPLGDGDELEAVLSQVSEDGFLRHEVACEAHINTSAERGSPWPRATSTTSSRTVV